MYPLDRRKLAVHVYGLFHSLRKTALILKVGHSTVARWLHSVERRPYPPRASKVQLIGPALRAIVLAEPFISLRSLQQRIQTIFGFSVSKELLRIALKGQKISWKKAKFYSEPPALEKATQTFLQTRQKYVAEGRLFVSLDETSFGRHGKIVRGYAPVGQPLAVRRKQARVTTVSCLAAVTHDCLVAREQLPGSFNTASFKNFLERLQLPTGAVLLLDNAKFHHAKIVKQLALLRQWQLLYVPPYSPWFNPIEGVFSIVKRKYYKGYSIAESFAAVTKAHLAAFMNKSLGLSSRPS